MNNILKKYAKLWYEGNYLKELVGAALSRLGDGVDTIAFWCIISQDRRFWWLHFLPSMVCQI